MSALQGYHGNTVVIIPHSVYPSKFSPLMMAKEATAPKIRRITSTREFTPFFIPQNPQIYVPPKTVTGLGPLTGGMSGAPVWPGEGIAGGVLHKISSQLYLAHP